MKTGPPPWNLVGRWKSNLFLLPTKIPLILQSLVQASELGHPVSSLILPRQTLIPLKFHFYFYLLFAWWVHDLYTYWALILDCDFWTLDSYGSPAYVWINMFLT